MFTILHFEEWLRMGLLYSHLIGCVLALAQILQADYSILTGRYEQSELHKVATRTTLLLLALWVTGLSIIYLDTGFDLQQLANNPKLLMKLLSVVVLTFNGFLLHRYAFPLLKHIERLTLRQSLLLTFTGALSTSHWLLAAFVGMAKPLAKVPFETLFTSWSIMVVALFGFSLLLTPLTRRLLLTREKTIYSTGLLASSS